MGSLMGGCLDIFFLCSGFDCGGAFLLDLIVTEPFSDKMKKGGSKKFGIKSALPAVAWRTDRDPCVDFAFGLVCSFDGQAR